MQPVPLLVTLGTFAHQARVALTSQSLVRPCVLNLQEQILSSILVLAGLLVASIFACTLCVRFSNFTLMYHT